MVDSNGSKSKFDISSINLSSNTNSNDGFTEVFSFLSKSISEPKINNAIKHANHEQYRELIKGHNTTFIKIPERSLSPLHHAVTCSNQDIDAIKKTINSVLQSGVDINHLDKDGNTPLMHLLSEAESQEKKYSKGNLTDVMKLLIERGASLNEHNESEWASASDLIDRLKNKKVLTQKEVDEIYKAQQDLKEKAKKELSVHVQDIEDVSIYGSYAKIQLKGNNKEEFKISEFLQSDFCKNNGISGFSTLHDNGKSGMHGVVSSEGVRHYVVTDGSYEMMLNWPVNGVNHTIKIHINSEGSVEVDKEYLDLYEAGKIDVAANKEVKLGNLSLAEALAKGRWKEKQVQNEVQNETIRSAIREPVQKNAATHAHEVESHNVMTSTPLSGAQQPNFGNVSPISYAGNHSPLSPEGNTFFERVFNEQNGTPKSQESNGWDDSLFPPIPSNSVLESQQQPVIQRQSELQQQQANNQPFTPIIEDGVNTQNPTSLQNSNPGSPKKTPPTPPIRRSSLPKGQQQLENQQQPVVQQKSVGHQKSENKELHNQPKSQQQHRSSGRESDSGYSSPTTSEFEPKINSKKAQEKRDRRQALQEENSEERIYSLKQLFKVNSEDVGKSNPSQLEKLLEDIRNRSKQDNRGLKKVHTSNEKSPQNEDASELQKKFDQEKYGLKTVITTNELPQNEDIPELQLRFNQENKGLRKANLTNKPPQNKDVPELQKKFDQEKYGLKTVTTTNEPPQNKDESELQKKFDQEKYGLGPIDPKERHISSQTKKHLIEAGLLEEISTGVKTDEVSTDSEQPSLPNSGNDSGFSSPTHTSHSKSQVDIQELEERLTNTVEQNLIDFDQELEIGEAWDSTYDFPRHDDSGLEEKELETEEELLEALETLSKELEDKEKNEQIDSETVELKSAPTDQVMSELKEALNPDSRTIPQDSNLGKLLEKNAAQLKIGVIEGEDTSEKSAIGDVFDRNRVKRGNQSTQLSKQIRQPWVERVTSTDNKDKGIS